MAARYFVKKREFLIDDLFMDEVGHATELTTLCSVAGKRWGDFFQGFDLIMKCFYRCGRFEAK